MINIFIVTRTSWIELPRIRHEITQQLSKYYNVFFIEAGGVSECKQFFLEKIDKNITRVIIPTLYCIPSFAKRYEIVLSVINDIYATRKITKLAQRNKSVFLINFNYDFFSLMNSSFFKGKIYFCNDDFISQAKSTPAKLIVRFFEYLTAKKADICLSNHDAMVKKLSAYNKKTYLFHHAHNFEVKLPSLKKSKVIKACYMGFIDERIDYKCLQELSIQPDIELHMIGPDKINFSEQNGVFHGPKIGKEVEELLALMDVLLIPFKDKSCMSLCSSTNKIFKYIATGKPVVVSGMPNFISFPHGVVYKISHCDPVSFLNAVRQANREDCKEYQNIRAMIARENSWDKRILQLKEIIDNFS